jgi:adenosylcobinamide kinase/adenosylcobinamide-phosphate guanylyltransferase
MTARIAAHRRERPSHWRVREEPIQLGRALREESKKGNLVLLDCLTLWISNCLWTSSSAREVVDTDALASSVPDATVWRSQRGDFLDALSAQGATDLIIVTNEVGTGIVPANPAARLFRDEQGWLNQLVAAACDEVFLVTAGLPLRLK